MFGVEIGETHHLRKHPNIGKYVWNDLNESIIPFYSSSHCTADGEIVPSFWCLNCRNKIGPKSRPLPKQNHCHDDEPTCCDSKLYGSEIATFEGNP